MSQPDTSPPDDPGTHDEPVGSVAQEAFKLLRAVAGSAGVDAAASRDADASTVDGHVAHDHVCSTGWCPVCQVVGFVRDHPDAIASVTRSANDLVRSLRDLVEVALAPEEKKQ